MLENYDVVVVGGGHAGIEASLATARMGLKTVLLTMNINTIGQMSCNPAIGGTAKGHLVREIDALGGEMGKITDDTGIHFKMLNKSKGPAVWSPRVQCDRPKYALSARFRTMNQKNLTVKEGMAVDVLVEGNKAIGVTNQLGDEILAKAIVLTCGTFLNGLIHIGLKHFSAGRSGEFPATGLTESLVKLGFESGRLKTGTPPRLNSKSINFDILEVQTPDEPPIPISFQTDPANLLNRKQLPCHITYTNLKTHEIIKSGLDRSPMFCGIIKGIGPRYCPSVEDKVVRFSERERHQIFLEPEGYDNNEYYVNGFSTSLPEDIQLKGIRSIKGLEEAEIIRWGYAIEYDFFPPHQIKHTLETKLIENLFFAGQINGTSGYEEAGAQGLMAGINAGLKVKGEKPFILDRSEAYIGVLIDDLVNKGTFEPYRMFTSRAEYRLVLRQDNADLRLMKYGYELGLIDKETYQKLLDKKEIIDKTLYYFRNTYPSINQTNELFEKLSISKTDQKEPLSQILKKNEVKIQDLSHFNLPEDSPFGEIQKYPSALLQVEIELKYEGYIKRQIDQIEKFKKFENKTIPLDFDYKSIPTLSKESLEKLSKVKPLSIGQAMRIPGITPSDISVLLIYIEKQKTNKSKKQLERV
jgi:tRNA uridine 5-carboxymethylaminomethyl modification enzyme